VSSRIEPGSGLIPGLENRATVSGAAFEREGAERFLGFGERSNAADQTGNEVFNWAEEGPFSSGVGEDLLRDLIPEFTFPTGPTATNFPIPWMLSSRGLGFLIDQTHRSRFRLASDRGDAWQAEAETSRFSFTAFAGPTPAAALRRYSDYAGRQPKPAPWIFGPWFQPTLETKPYELADRFRDEDVPVTVAQTYTHYLPCGAHVGNEEAEANRVKGYHERGYKITTYFNPHICTSYSPVYDQAAASGLLVKNQLGQPYLLTNPFTADQVVSEVDFTHPGGPAFFSDLLDDAIAQGYDGWMEDFGEYTPHDSRFANGKSGLEMHNAYPVAYHCASYEHTSDTMGRNAAVFIRSGWHGVQPCARVVWGGDPTEDWSCSDGLCAAVHQALSVGMSGIAYWGSDIGGFHALVNPRTSDELNARWLEFGAVSGVMRTQANGLSLQDNRPERSQVWSPEVLPVWRRYAKLRTQLLPYLRVASRAYQRSGLPISRHLALAYPDDPEAVARQDEFLFGPDLLAAPVIEEGATERSLYLPRGRWIDLWRSARFADGPGALALRRAQVLRGRSETTVPAPLEELPLFVRAGAVIPALPPDVDTLAAEGERKGLVNLRDRSDRRVLYAFPRGDSRGRIEGGHVVSSEGAGKWNLRIAGNLRSYSLHASLGAMRERLVPCEVRLAGEALPKSAWRYDRAERILHARFRTSSGTLTAKAC
jgi:sulfoquinovosidase